MMRSFVVETHNMIIPAVIAIDRSVGSFDRSALSLSRLKMTIGIAALFAVTTVSAAIEARRGPGGVFGIGAVAGSPTAIEFIAIPVEVVSVELRLGLGGFTDESYVEVGLQLHPPELLRRPLWSARASMGAGAYSLTEGFASLSNSPGEIGIVANPSLLIESSILPLQLVVSVPVRLPLVKLEDRELADFSVGVSGGLRYFF